MANKTGNKPISKYRSGKVTIDVWENEIELKNGQKAQRKSYSLNKNYQDKEGNWKATNSFNKTELTDALIVTLKALIQESDKKTTKEEEED